MDIETPGKMYHTGKHRKYSCQYHVVFCPKYRRKVLSEEISEVAKSLLLQKQDAYGYILLAAEIMPDHIHLLLDVDPIHSVYAVVSKIKGMLAHELREQFPKLKTRLPCLWSRGKFISSVGAVSLEVVKKYIEEQKGR